MTTHPEYAAYLESADKKAAQQLSAHPPVAGVPVHRAELIPRDDTRTSPAEGSIPAVVTAMEQAGASTETIASTQALGQAIEGLQKSIALVINHVSELLKGADGRTD